MTATDVFRLEAHAGPREHWPLSSRLLRAGQPTSARLPGYALRYQFQTVEGGFLFLSDEDCPMDEVAHFCLYDASLRRLSHRSLGGLPWRQPQRPSSFNLTSAQPVNETTLAFTFAPDDAWELSLRPWGLLWVWPRLVLTQLPTPRVP